jgi:hypothetical protein
VHRLTTSFLLGYHGCSQETAQSVLGGDAFVPSENDYDWLGPGIYFWQANPKRALQFAQEKRNREVAAWKPAVIGAVIDPGLCLDLATDAGIGQVKVAHQVLIRTAKEAGTELPQNIGGDDLWLRKLDCAVITMLHDIRKSEKLDPVDTVAGIFIEGKRLYATAGFHEKTHVQLCVYNPRQIRGVFRVGKDQLS